MTTSNSDYIIESPMEAALWDGWETLKKYLSRMEDYLQKATEQFEARISRQKKTLTPEQLSEFEIDDVEEYAYYYDEFPKILRNHLLVSAYSLFEYDMKAICRSIKDKQNIRISLSDLKGNLLEQVKLYWRLANLDLPCDQDTWEEISKYCKVRNCIVHDSGLIKRDDKDLITYVQGKGLIKKRVVIFDKDAEPEVGLTKKFCEEVVETMQNFIDAAYKTSMEQIRKAGK